MVNEKKINNLSDIISFEQRDALLALSDSASGSDECFITALYRVILHREADDGGMQVYIKRLQEGGSRAAIIQTFLCSQENLRRPLIEQVLTDQEVDRLLALEGEAFVEASYKHILKRNVDQNGLEARIQALSEGRSKIEIMAELVRSDEARERFIPIEPNFQPVPMPPVLPAPFMKRVERKLKRLIAPPKPSVFDMVATPPFVVLRGEGITEAPEEVGIENVNTGVSSIDAQVVVKRIFQKRPEGGALWFDMTTTMHWGRGVVGIVRAELEIARALRAIHPDIRYSMQLGSGFIEIEQDKLDWLFEADDITDAYVERFGRQEPISEQNPPQPTFVQLGLVGPELPVVTHPYEQDDFIFSMGWLDSAKEEFFTKVRAQLPSLGLCYLVYDIIVLGKTTRQFYLSNVQEKFEAYLKWISKNCNFVFYGGETAKADTEALFAEKGWRVPEGRAVQFGTDITKGVDELLSEDDLEEMGITQPFVMTVGTLEPRKNHETLYKAYLLALEEDPDNTPQLVIVGRPAHRVSNLIDKIERNPKVQGRIIIIQPSDAQLTALYRAALFMLLPSLYEGWSLALPESLGFGKFCLTAKTPPLQEIGGDLIEYVDPYDVRGWAEAILKFSKNKHLLKTYEAAIKKKWPKTTWRDTAAMIYSGLQLGMPKMPVVCLEPEIWYDLSLTYLLWRGGVSGIPRAELVFARYLKKHKENVHFFAYDRGGLFEIPHDNLLWLFDEGDMHTAYRYFQQFWDDLEATGAGSRTPFMDGSNILSHPSNIRRLPDNAVVISTGIDFGIAESRTPGELLSRTEYLKEISKYSYNITLSQLIYDFTPFLIPHCHLPQTCAAYEIFIQYVSNNFDFLVYGGRTALKDGLAIQAEYGWESPASDFIEFGSDLDSKAKISKARDAALLKEHGIDRDFIMTVGTIEPRKNHEMLYKAYLMLLDAGVTDLPQMIFVGKPGWLTQDFLETFRADDRIKDHIMLMSPDDEFLDVLYRNCRFTVLASMYEGWSLTLPESLSYGKFCLVAKTPPLIETGRDLVEYINCYDTKAWADRIMHYIRNPKEVKAWETKIKRKWKSKSWETCAQDLLHLTMTYHTQRYLTTAE